MEALSVFTGDNETEEAHMGGDLAEDDDSDDDKDGLAPSVNPGFYAHWKTAAQ